MTHLAKQHTIFGVIGKEIADIATVRRMAGDATHLAATPDFGGVNLAAERMPAISDRSPDDMLLLADIAVTRQA